MVNEHNEKYDDQDEGEYHFSDDQVNYEAEADGVKIHEGSSGNAKQSMATMFNQNRRMIIIVLVIFVIIYVLYKMLSPPAETVPTDFKPVASQAKPLTTTPPSIATSALPATAPLFQPPVPTAPAVQPTPPPTAPAVQPSVATVPSSPLPTSPTSAPLATTNNVGQVTSQPPPSMPGTTTTATLPTQSTTQVIIPTNPTVAATPEMVESQKNIVDKLVALEEENSKLSNILRTQFVQKIADYEAHNNATQERLQNLNRRMANMEASLNKMAQMLQSVHRAPPVAIPVEVIAPVAKVIEPKMIFTVQAIIPGRAWLKADSGETVTVAVGDMLRDYGRITKIDPYDGIVAIDTGRRIITLSYGAGGD